MKSYKNHFARLLFVISFLLILSGLISIMYAKTALVGYVLLFVGIILAGIVAVVFVPSHHKI